MASPFRVFRKHQKWLLVVLGFLAIVAFVIGDSLMSLAGGQRAPDPVVATSVHGSIRESDLHRMLQMRRILNSFLQTAWETGYRRSGTPPRVFPIQRAETEKEVVEMMLLARKAEQMGLVVSNKSINHYLKQLTNDSISSTEFRQILGTPALENRRVTMDVLFDALRDDLLALKLQETYESAAAVTPAELWTPFLKLNDRVTIEWVPVPVEKFVDEVKAPSDQELLAFFEKHKNEYDRPRVVSGVLMKSAEPGFKQPAKAAFQYVMADYGAVVDLAAQEITDQQIAEYYEENKRQFIRPQLFEEEQQDQDTANQKTDEDAPQQEGDPDAPQPESDQEAPEQQSDQESPEQQPVDEVQEGETEGQLFSVDDPPADQPADEPQSQDIPAEDGGETEPQTRDDQPQDDQTRDDQPQDESQTGAQAEAQVVEPEPAPLEEVADQIRRELARQKAPELRAKVLAPVEMAMESYSRKRSGAEIDSRQAEPAKQILKPLADEHRLTLDETPLLSHLDLESEAIGQSTVAGQGQKFFNYAFMGRLANFVPVMTIDDEGNAYLIWKVQEHEEFVPDLKEIRSDVVHAWKMIQARKLAQNHAKDLAEVARKSGLPLGEAFAEQQGIEVVQSEPFTWLTEGAVPSGGYRPRLRLSTIEGVDGADDDFMQAVFALDAGDVAVAQNHAKTAAFVVRLSAHQVSREALREQFLNPSAGAWVQLAQSENQRQLLTALTEEVEAEAELKPPLSQWREQPDLQDPIDL